MRQNLLSLSSALSLSLHLLLFEISVSAVGREGTLKGEESGPGGSTAAREQPSRPAARGGRHCRGVCLEALSPKK